MARKIAPVPKGYRTVTPYLVVRGADAAMDFYTEVFGAKVVSRVYGDDDVTVLHAEMKIGNSIVIVSDERPAFGVLSPLAFGSSPVAQHLYLPASMPHGKKLLKLAAQFWFLLQTHNMASALQKLSTHLAIFSQCPSASYLSKSKRL